MYLMYLSAVGLPSPGTLNILTWAFGGDGLLSVAPVPQDLGSDTHTYVGSILSFPVYKTTNYPAYAFEFGAGKFHEKTEGLQRVIYRKGGVRRTNLISVNIQNSYLLYWGLKFDVLRKWKCPDTLEQP